MKDFKDKVAFITGGASGLGLAMAKAFGREGMKVMIADIEEKALAGAVETLRAMQIRAEGVPCDVADRGRVREAALKTIAAFGKVHVVCNNAGVAAGAMLGDVSESDWDWVIDVNLKGVVYGVETFAPLIQSHGEGGHIVNTASIAGMISPPGMEVYAASKFAVVAMSEGWAGQLAPKGIGVSVLCPGFVQTRINQSDRARQDRYGHSSALKGELAAAAAHMVETGIPADPVGARVVEAIKADELYIFTHPGMRHLWDARVEAVRAGWEACENSPALKGLKSESPKSLSLTPPKSSTAKQR